MNPEKCPSEKMYAVVHFLAKQQGMSVDNFLDKILADKQKAEEEEKMLETIRKEIEALPESARVQLLRQFSKIQTKSEPRKSDRPFSGQRSTLEELKDSHQDELTGTRPSALIVNGQKTFVKDWTEATEEFVKLLLANGDLSDKHLPLIVSGRGTKAYINNTDTQLGGKDALFKKIGEGVYVDTKYNALGHVKNMHNALKILAVIGKYSVEFEF